MCFCLFNGHLKPTAGSGVSVCLTSLTACVSSNWRSEPCGIRTVLQSVSWSHFSPLFTVTLPRHTLLQSTSAQPGRPVILAPTVCFELILFLTYSPIFPPEMPASFESCIFSASLRHFGSHRASFDYELFRLVQRHGEVWSERNAGTCELFVVYGEFVCLFVVYGEFVCCNISLEIQRLYGTYRSLWCVLIFMVHTDLYGAYWYLWYILIFMVRTDIYVTFWSLWCVLIFMLHTDLYGAYWYLLLSDLYGAYWYLWYILIFMVRTDIYVTFLSLWCVLIFMLHTDLYGTYWSLWYFLIFMRQLCSTWDWGPHILAARWKVMSDRLQTGGDVGVPGSELSRPT
jgi:hypothetical protein